MMIEERRILMTLAVLLISIVMHPFLPQWTLAVIVILSVVNLTR